MYTYRSESFFATFVVHVEVLEFIAFFAGVIYLVGIGKSKRWGWWFGAINASIYVYASITVGLYVQSILQVLYVFLACLGYWNWGREEGKEVKQIPTRTHLIGVSISVLTAAILAWVMSYFTAQQLAVEDAFISVFAVFATYLTITHVLENWYYWLGINAASIYLFGMQGLYVTASLFLVNFLMSVWGLYAWGKQRNV